jgi:DNA-binding transcriptional MocR family regulator
MVPIQYVPAGRNAKELSDSLEAGIRTGALLPGALLPSVRGLAAEVDLAPGTVAASYRQLRERGLVESHGRQGTRVRPRPAVAARSAVAVLDRDVVDLASGQPDPGLLPSLPTRLRAVNRPAAAPTELLVPELLRLGRDRLGADGIPADALTVSSGGLDGIQRLLTAQLRPGDLVAVEDPGWPNLIDLAAALGMRAYPVAVDADGPRADSLQTALRAGVRAVILTNRAQNPTGVRLSAARARELRGVLGGHPSVLTVEDDHAAELAGAEPASIAGVTDAWAFVRSTSKPYGPDLRVALVAGDEATIARLDGRMRAGSGWVSTVLQQLVIDLWSSPGVAATVARAATAYDARRERLIAELGARGVAAIGDTGLNVWVPVQDETTVISGLLAAGWAVAPGARFRQTSGPGVRITVSGLTIATIPRLADDLATAVAAPRAGSYST